MGMTIVGKEILSKFIIKNNSDRTVAVGNVVPSYRFGDPGIDGHEYDFGEFIEEKNKPPLKIEPNEEKEIIIKYKSENNPFYRPGKKIMKMLIGLYDPETVEKQDNNDIIKESDIILKREFLIIARKTEQYIDLYPKIIDFDSVYVNPKEEYYWPVKIQNSNTITHTLDSWSYEMLSPVITDNELLFDGLELPIEIPGWSDIPWRVGYYPRNREGDSAWIKFQYVVKSEEFGNNEVEVQTLMKGFGVEQEIGLHSSSSGTISRDTLDFGEVWVGDSKEERIVLANYGNIPFGAERVEMLEYNRDREGKQYSIQRALLAEKTNIFPNETDTIDIEFVPLERGEHIERLYIKSNLMDRKIKVVPEGEEIVELYMKGLGVEPEIGFNSDGIDMGKVFIRSECPNSRDSILYVMNRGNTELRIKSIYVKRAASEFSVDTKSMILDVDETKGIKIEFSSNNAGLIYEDSLIFETNCNPPYDRVAVYLKAEGVEPLGTKIEISNNIRSKPGRIILVGLKTDEHIGYAKTFIDTLSYDRSILKFIDLELENTASEGALVAKGKEFSNGRLALELGMPSNTYFMNRDTLLKLRFKCYLGEQAMTGISFQDPKFGDGECGRVLSPQVSNGRFYLDSVCGLTLKALPFSGGSYKIVNCAPNPVDNELSIDVRVLLKSNVNISIYNSYGQLVGEILDNELERGEHNISYDCSGYSAGVYYCVMRAGLYTESVQIVISK